MSRRTSEIAVTVNGERYEREIEDRTLLVHFLRDDLGLTGTHQGCVVGKCGACTVRHEGTAKKSCLLYARQMDGESLTTVEGLSDEAEAEGTALETRDGARLHPLQLAFKRNHGLQCGFCTPGFLMSAADLLERTPDPDREEIESAISGNVCRCTGYRSIVDSIEAAAAIMDEDADTPPGGPDRAAEDSGGDQA